MLHRPHLLPETLVQISSVLQLSHCSLGGCLSFYPADDDTTLLQGIIIHNSCISSSSRIDALTARTKFDCIRKDLNTFSAEETWQRICITGESNWNRVVTNVKMLRHTPQPLLEQRPKRGKHSDAPVLTQPRHTWKLHHQQHQLHQLYSFVRPMSISRCRHY